MYLKTLRSLLFASILCAIFLACKKDPSLPAPGALNVTNISDTGCSISWNAVSGASAYKITLALDASFNNIVNGFNAREVTATDINVNTLKPFTKYYVKVIANNNNKSSSAIATNFMTLDVDNLVIISQDNKDLYAFDARAGEVRWTFTGTPFYATPIIYDSVVYIGGFDGRVYAIRISNGSLKWKSEKARNGARFTANALIKNGILFIGDDFGTCHGYNVNDGSVKWQYDIIGPYKGVNSTPVWYENTAYFASFDGKIYALDANTGSYKWSTASTGNPITSGMSLVNGVIYVGAIPKVYAFDATTGATKWITPNPRYTSFFSSPTVADNAVFIGGEDGIVYAFSTTDGSIIWSKVLSYGGIVSSPVYKNGNIYIDGGDGNVYALQSSSGNVVWKNNEPVTKTNFYSGPTLSEKSVYSGTLDGTILSIDIQTGLTKWRSTITDAKFYASPCVISCKGDVYYPGITGSMQ